MLNPTSVAYAEIGDAPVYDQPQSLAEIRSGSMSHESYYVVPNTGGFCAYPLQAQGAPTFSVSDFFSSEVRNLPARFGKPTQLEVPPHLDFGAAIYEPWADQAYAPDVNGLRWYLVGDGERYQEFFGGILEYAGRLFKEWKESPRAMAAKTWPRPEGFEEPSRVEAPSTFEAWIEMSKFEGWLSQTDPELFAQAKPYLHYTTEMPHDFCASEITEDSYAYYTLGEDRIYLLPRSIRTLKNGDYAAVAQTLAHEVSHRENLRKGLVLPSDEMLQRSLQYFHDLVMEDSLALGLALSVLGQDFFHILSCRRLPMIPEEEIDAFLSDLAYGQSQIPAHQSADTHQESIDAVTYLIEQVHREFPASWHGLLADYVRLAQANHEQARTEVFLTSFTK